MTIELSPEQERAVQEAIKNGFVRSVDEFIDAPLQCCPNPKTKVGIPARPLFAIWKSSQTNITSAREILSLENSCMNAIATDSLTPADLKRLICGFTLGFNANRKTALGHEI